MSSSHFLAKTTFTEERRFKFTETWNACWFSQDMPSREGRLEKPSMLHFNLYQKKKIVSIQLRKKASFYNSHFKMNLKQKFKKLVLTTWWSFQFNPKYFFNCCLQKAEWPAVHLSLVKTCFCRGSYCRDYDVTLCSPQRSQRGWVIPKFQSTYGFYMCHSRDL